MIFDISSEISCKSPQSISANRRSAISHSFSIGFPKKIRGGNGAEIAESLREKTSLLDKYLVAFVANLCFHEKKCTRNLGSSKKVIFSSKVVYLAFGFTTLPRICRLDGTWGHFVLPPASPCLLNICYRFRSLP